MRKEKVTFDELSLMSFLKFDRLDGMDLTVLREMVGNNFDLDVEDNCDNYFVSCDGTIVLNNSYVDKFYKNINNDMIDKIEKTKVYKKIDEINYFEFILRKIRIMGEGAVLVDELDDFFDIGIINRLCKEGYIRKYSHKDTIYGDYEAIKLTKRGKLYLYLIDNKKQIDNFANTLKEIDCDESLIPLFLIAQDLDGNIDKILTISNFMNFCHEYGYSIFKKDNVLRKKREK